MKIKYDREVDVLYIQFSAQPVAESDEDKPGVATPGVATPGVIIDYAEDGSIIGLEIMDASRKMPEPTRFEYEVA